MPSFGAATFWMSGRPPVEPLRARGVPMLLAALAFAAGILCARQWHGPLALLLSIVALLGLVWASLRWAPRAAWLVVLAMWAVVGCWCAQVQTPVDRQLKVNQYADGLSRTVRGRVVSIRSLRETKPVQGAPVQPLEPWQLEPGGWEDDGGAPIQSVDLALDSVERVTPDVSTMDPVNGGLRLTVMGGSVPLRCGEVVEAPVRLREPEIYRDPGAFSYADWLLGQGVGAAGTTKVTKVRVVGAGAPGRRGCDAG